MRTGYLSLTRGDGGQNLIGPSRGITWSQENRPGRTVFYQGNWLRVYQIWKWDYSILGWREYSFRHCLCYQKIQTRRDNHPISSRRCSDSWSAYCIGKPCRKGVQSGRKSGGFYWTAR
jgi:hypothetical protein